MRPIQRRPKWTDMPAQACLPRIFSRPFSQKLSQCLRRSGTVRILTSLDSRCILGSSRCRGLGPGLCGLWLLGVLLALSVQRAGPGSLRRVSPWSRPARELVMRYRPSRAASCQATRDVTPHRHVLRVTARPAAQAGRVAVSGSDAL